MARSLTSLLLFALVTSPVLADQLDANKHVILRIAEAINTRDFEALDELVSPNVRRHSAATPNVKVENLEQFKSFLKQDIATCPDSRQEINMILAEGNLVAMHATYLGTQTGPMGPFPPSGKKLELPIIAIFRLQDGRVAEIWVEWDNLNALNQLGHFPPEGKGEAKSEVKNQ